MTYPLSSDVVAGQPTAADHYNNLRADALRLGQAYADSVNLAEAFARFEQNLTIQLLGTDRLRVPATVAAPVVLVVDGYFILKTTSNIDLPSGGKPSGSEMMWYLFAVRTPGSTTFTLEVNTSAMESSGRRLIGSFYWNGTAIPAPSIRTALALAHDSLVNHLQFTGCQGRMSLDTGTAVKDGESAAITFHPYKGNLISLYTPGFGWNNYPIAINGTKPAFTPFCLVDHVYDVFAYWDGSKVVLESLVWTNSTSRATPLTLTDGMYLKSTDLTRLYLGSFVAYLNSDIRDLPSERGLWNYFNRIAKPVLATVATSSWTYNVPGTWRSPNASDAMIRVCQGLLEDLSIFEVNTFATAAASLFGMVGIGDNSNSTNSATVNTMTGASTQRVPIRAVYNTVLSLGLHSIYWIENTNGSGVVTFFGNPLSGAVQAGLTGIVFC